MLVAALQMSFVMVEDIFSSPVLYIYSIVFFFFLQIYYFTRIHSPHHLALQALSDIFSAP